MSEDIKQSVIAYLKLKYKFVSKSFAMLEIEEIFGIEYIESFHTVNEAIKEGWIVLENSSNGLFEQLEGNYKHTYDITKFLKLEIK